MRTHRSALAFVALCIALVASLALVPMALAAGTGDDPTPTSDVLAPKEASVKTRLERETATTAGSLGAAPDAVIAPLAVDAPYRYLYTASHKQERPYWCGPATVQVIDDYHGAHAPQSTYANAMGTGPGGTDFSRVDDCLRTYSGKPYYYYGGLSEGSFSGRVADSILNHTMPLAADVRILASVWPNYNYNHDGHIVPIEAFDWRYDTVRLNDVFNEADYYGGGGSTYGHTTYSRAVVWHGVYNHFRRAVVSAP